MPPCSLSSLKCKYPARGRPGLALGLSVSMMQQDDVTVGRPGLKRTKSSQVECFTRTWVPRTMSHSEGGHGCERTAPQSSGNYTSAYTVSGGLAFEPSTAVLRKTSLSSNKG